MYDIEFYDDERGYSDVEEFIKELREKSDTSKDARINMGIKTFSKSNTICIL